MQPIETATTLALSRAYPCHPVLAGWIDALLSNPTEQMGLDEYAAAHEEQMEHAHAWRMYADADVAEAIERLTAIPEHAHSPRRSAELEGLLDRCHYRLALSLVNYRRYGEDWSKDLAEALGYYPIWLAESYNHELAMQ